jgi:ankyrin repeat protein
MQNQDLNTAGELVRAGADTQATLPDGRTAAMFAMHLPASFASTVINNTRKLTAVDKQGRGLLWYAVDAGRADNVKLLVQRQPSLTRQNNETYSVVHAAAKLDSPVILKMLIESGLSVDSRNDQGNTPLMVAADAGKKQNIDLLIGKGASLDLQDNVGNTALILATMSNRKDCVKRLLDAGADIDLRNKKREKAIHIAEQHEYAELTALLDDHAKNSSFLKMF